MYRTTTYSQNRRGQRGNGLRAYFLSRDLTPLADSTGATFQVNAKSLTEARERALSGQTVWQRAA